MGVENHYCRAPAWHQCGDKYGDSCDNPAIKCRFMRKPKWKCVTTPCEYQKKGICTKLPCERRKRPEEEPSQVGGDGLPAPGQFGE